MSKIHCVYLLLYLNVCFCRCFWMQIYHSGLYRNASANEWDRWRTKKDPSQRRELKINEKV